LATGVARLHPLVAGDYQPWLKFAAKGNTYYCPDCEGPELLNRDIVVIGVNGANSAIAVSQPLLEFASSIRVLLTGGMNLKPEWERKRAELNLEVIRGHIRSVDGKKGIVEAINLEDGTRIVADGYYVQSDKLPRNDLAKQLNLQLGEHGHIKTGWRGQALLPDGEHLDGVWAAGDVQPQTQQVSIAAGSGNIAAVMIDQFLTKLEPRRLGRRDSMAEANARV
jgi:thioredoxin reductase (NADPH)